jgi:hypothetical protein
MKNKFMLPLGMLCLASYILLARYTNTEDFILGLLLGLSIALNLVGVYIMIKQLKK